MNSLTELTAVEAAACIRDGSISAEGYVAALIARGREFRSLNAFAAFDENFVLERARECDLERQCGNTLKPLHGLPITLKDNINTAYLPTSAGTPALSGNFCSANAPVAASLEDAGAILFGKNTMHELAFGVTSNNAATGAVRNPWKPEFIAGGSSGGTAAAVAARLVPAGIGTDTGGSVRVPAALCGICGFRPTVKRWPQAGLVPAAPTRDTAGPMARSVADLALLNGIVTHQQALPGRGQLAGLRLGVPRRHFWEDLDADTRELAEDALLRLRDAGVSLVECDLGPVVEATGRISFMFHHYEFRPAMTAYLAKQGAGISFEDVVAGVASPDVRPLVAATLDPAQEIAHAAYLEARGARESAGHQLKALFAAAGIEALVFPTTPRPAARIGEDAEVLLGGRRVPTFRTFIRNTDAGSVLGLPGVTLPVGLSREGLPIGLGIDGLPDTDDGVLAVAAAMQTIIPFVKSPIRN